MQRILKIVVPDEFSPSHRLNKEVIVNTSGDHKVKSKPLFNGFTPLENIIIVQTQKHKSR